jgi:hypothetical protein
LALIFQEKIYSINGKAFFMKNKTLVIYILISYCALVGFVNTKTTNHSENYSADFINKFMWENFHRGNYDSIPSVINKLKNAYLQNPKDKKITSYLAFTYLWGFSERSRKENDSSIAEYVYQSNYFFKEAIKLNPDDARLRGFQSVTEICEGALKRKWITLAKGYINGLLAIEKWPQFNKFAFSLIGSQRNKNSPAFKLGMNFQWQLIDDCSCNKLDKKTILNDPGNVLSEMIEELKRSNDIQKKRVCRNTWIAPHNLEGFFLNLGDMLVKDGHLKEAKEIYSAAKFSPTYSDWPYQNVLEERIRNAEKNAIEFNKPLELFISSNRNQIFINSAFSCMGCHQMSKKEFENSEISPD